MNARDTGSGTSVFGAWGQEHGLPVFRETLSPDDPTCEWDPIVQPRTTRHWCGFGNRRFQVFAENVGTTAIWDTAHEFRWITAAEPGTGATTLSVAGTSWATDRDRWPASWIHGQAPTRTWGPTWFTVAGSHDGVAIERMVFCPDGDVAWVLIRVVLTCERMCAVDVGEEWCLASRSVTMSWADVGQPQGSGTKPDDLPEPVADELGISVCQSTSTTGRQVVRLQSTATAERPTVIRTTVDGQLVRLDQQVTLEPGAPTTLWFAVGLPDEDEAPSDPERTWSDSLSRLHARLPKVRCDRVPALVHEVPWHYALLTGGACTDAVLGGHTLDQGSAYSFHFGFNGAARDPLQHALPLVYSEPDLALSVLRNTCSWASPTGELPYALNGEKQPLTERFHPSDQALWAIWLAAEYAAATGDLAAFDEPLGFHPVHDAPPAALIDHLVRQFRHLIDVIGVGIHGHIRIQNADWNDSALVLTPIERSEMEAHGESILNSAMAAWVLPRFAGLLRRLAKRREGTSAGLDAVAAEADRRAEQWRVLVADEWTGRWYRRAHGPGATVGEDEMWLEVQPWAILCGAASDDRATELLATIQTALRSGSPLGARLRGPLPIRVPSERFSGESTSGGIWFSINMTLAWAAASLDPELAWDELRCMTLAAHTDAYPSIWEGTISGPDAYNTPESARPGHTWRLGTHGMQTFPVNNLHSHAQVLFTYLRLLGVEPTIDGSLHLDGRGGSFISPVLEVDGAGHGSLRTLGPVMLDLPDGARRTESAGLIRW